MEVTCFLKREGNQYASLCVELDVASCGRTKKDALDGLNRAIEAYIEYMVSEGREKEMYRPVPMNELKQFLFPEDDGRISFLLIDLTCCQSGSMKVAETQFPSS